MTEVICKLTAQVAYKHAPPDTIRRTITIKHSYIAAIALEMDKKSSYSKRIMRAR